MKEGEEENGGRREGQMGRRGAASCGGTAYSPSSSGAKAGVFRGQGQPGLCNKPLFVKKTRRGAVANYAAITRC